LASVALCAARLAGAEPAERHLAIGTGLAIAVVTSLVCIVFWSILLGPSGILLGALCGLLAGLHGMLSRLAQRSSAQTLTR